MKKRTISLFMSLVMMALLCCPAFAHTSLEDVEFLTPTSLDKVTVDVLPKEDVFFADETSNTCTAMPEEDDEVAPLATTIPNEVSIQYVKIYPIVTCDEIEGYFFLDKVMRARYWTYVTQSDSLRLSPAAVTAFVEEAFTWLYSQSETAPYNWSVVGWHVETKVALSAQKPLRVEYRPYYPRSGETFETITKNIPTQYYDFEASYDFPLPANLDTYYYIGFEGGFYFTYATGPNAGKEGGLAMAPGVAMNY